MPPLIFVASEQPPANLLEISPSEWEQFIPMRGLEIMEIVP